MAGDMGYSFTCDNCNKEVQQAGFPELIFLVTITSEKPYLQTQSDSLQCCTRCIPVVNKQNKSVLAEIEAIRAGGAAKKIRAVQVVEPDEAPQPKPVRKRKSSPVQRDPQIEEDARVLLAPMPMMELGPQAAAVVREKQEQDSLTSVLAMMATTLQQMNAKLDNLNDGKKGTTSRKR